MQDRFLTVDVKYQKFFQGFWTRNGYPTERAIKCFPGLNFEHTQFFSRLNINTSYLLPKFSKQHNQKLVTGPKRPYYNNLYVKIYPINNSNDNLAMGKTQAIQMRWVYGVCKDNPKNPQGDLGLPDLT